MTRWIFLGACIWALFLKPLPLAALDPNRAPTQYTRTVWTQADGLPQDTIRAIAQTPDGYLWLGTNEGLARFDGYEFANFTAEGKSLPSNTVGKLLVGRDGTLWIGTGSGLSRYAQGKFTSFGSKNGLAPGIVTGIAESHDGALWVVAGGRLCRLLNGVITTYPRETLAPIQSPQSVYEDSHHNLWIGGDAGLIRGVDGHFQPVIGAGELEGSFITSLIETKEGLWAGGTKGLILVRPDGTRTRFTTSDGLPNNFVLALREDRNRNLWIGTYAGLCRLDGDHFVSYPQTGDEATDWVWSLFEDREGDLWVGMNAGLTQLRDDRFSNYGRPEGLPGDAPYVVRQDRAGTMWIGYHDSGVVAMRGSSVRAYTTRDGLPSNEIFSLRETRNGDLLIGTRNGLSRMSNGHFSNQSVVDRLGRTAVYDALEDRTGAIWAATARGVYRLDGRHWTAVIPDGGGTGYTVTLAEDSKGVIWAGSMSRGLWKIANGEVRRYTSADGMRSEQLRSLYADKDGTLWIGTFGGGLMALSGDQFLSYSVADGLLSDNIAHVEDDLDGNLWLSTTRGIARVSKKQLKTYSAHQVSALTPINYGIADGLRSLHCAPAAPSSGGGMRAANGTLWFTTTRGLVSMDPQFSWPAAHTRVAPPITHLLEMTADNRRVETDQPISLAPGTSRIQIRFAGLYLAGSQRVRYSYKLEGLDAEWTPPSARRLAAYNPLPYGKYRFLVKSFVPGGGSSESELRFEVQPRFYQRSWFLLLGAIALASAAYAAYRLRLKSVHDRFALVFEERARIAREIHDTLAQGYVGISSQLDALAMKFDGGGAVARSHLALAQKMARHSLIEARRSVMDLRSSELDRQDLPAALADSARRWAANSAVEVEVNIDNMRGQLPEDLEQNIFRISQEAVINAVKHAGARLVRIELRREESLLRLRIQDDGRGFEPPATYSVFGGHFGILGMRERAERLRGEFILSSKPGAGTQVEVRIPFEQSNLKFSRTGANPV